LTDILQEHVKRVNLADKSVLLGRLCWYTVSQTLKVSHADVVNGLNTVGLSSTIPPYPKDFDVFRRVASNAARKKIPTSNVNVFENYLVEDFGGRGENVICRRIVRQTVDRKGRKLDYVQLRDIEFHKNTTAIVVKDLPDNVNGNLKVDEITEEIRSEFAAWKDSLNAYAIREFIRKRVLDFGATLVREGGAVYFITEDQAVKMESLETFVNALPGTESTFHSLPLIDDKKQRQMVRKAFEAETCDAVDEIMAEITEIQRTGKQISSDRYAKLVTDYQRLTARTVEYEELLETGLGEAKSRMSLFETAIVGLKTSVKF